MIARLLSLLLQVWRIVVGPAVYHPAAHYMRGPGPKCREKLEKTRPPVSRAFSFERSFKPRGT